MSDEPDRQDLEDRVEQLESTISKMLPGRRDALKLGGAALVGGAAMSGAASAQPGDQDGEAGVIGTDNSPVDIEASDIEVDDLVVNGTATGPFGSGLQGARVFLSSDQSVSVTNTKIQFDSEIYDSDSNFDTTSHNFTCPETGIYAVNLQVNFAGGGSGETRKVFVGSGSEAQPIGEGSVTQHNNTNNFEIFQSTTMNKYSQGDTIAGYVNTDSNQDVNGGSLNFRSFMEFVFLGGV